MGRRHQACWAQQVVWVVVDAWGPSPSIHPSALLERQPALAWRSTGPHTLRPLLAGSAPSRQPGAGGRWLSLSISEPRRRLHIKSRSDSRLWRDVGCVSAGGARAQPWHVCLLNTSRTSGSAWLPSTGSSEARRTGVSPGCPDLAGLSWKAIAGLNSSSEQWGQLSLRNWGG